MSKGLKITLIIISVAAASGVAYYFARKAQKRAKAYRTSVTPSLAKEVIGVVNANQI